MRPLKGNKPSSLRPKLSDQPLGVNLELIICFSYVKVKQGCYGNLMLLHKLIMKLVSCCFSMSRSLYLSAREIDKGGDWQYNDMFIKLPHSLMHE